VVTGECERPAVMTAQVNSAGQVASITVVDPGEGYRTTALIELIGGLTEAEPWQANAEAFAGSVIETPAGLVYTVNTTGIFAGTPPFATESPVINGTVTLTYLGTRARAVARMGNGQVRSFTTTLRYDRYEYASSIIPWQEGVVYTAGDLVRYDDLVWQAVGTPTTTEFDFDSWTQVDAATYQYPGLIDQVTGRPYATGLTGVDRTMGLYVPTANQPGLDLALLISGVDYPGVQVQGVRFDQNSGFDVGNYDINPFDNISYDAVGRPSYDPAILDAIYESEFDDPFLGVLPAPAYGGAPVDTRVGAIEVNGGAFVDTYSSHAPEELVPGAIFDTLDMRVFSSPGADWLADGHGFAIRSRRYVSGVSGLYFGDLVTDVASIRVWNATIGTQLIPLTQYTVDWENFTVMITAGASLGDIINITAYGVGGGNQLFRQGYAGDQIGDEVLIPLQISLIQEIVVFANGVPTNDFTYAAESEYTTRIDFGTTYTDQDWILITVLGEPIAGDYSWSSPVTQYTISDGVNLQFTLDNSLQGTNPANIVVEVNGRRARPAAGQEYLGDGITATYDLPSRGGYLPSAVADNEVSVYVNNQRLSQPSEFQVDPWDGSSEVRSVTLAQAPALGAQILVSVDTNTDYFLSGNTVVWRSSAGLIPLLGDVVSFTTWNDTAEQDIVTRVFVGPSVTGEQVTEPYDSTLFDEGTVTGDAGSYDYADIALVEINRFDIGRTITNTDRIMVSINGLYKFAGLDFLEESDFDVEGSEVIIPGPILNATDVVVITVFTNSVVPGSIAFRIFQDMRGQQLSYRILPQTSTILTEPLLATDDVIHVDDARKLPQPNMPQGFFGQITINGERITYREKDDGTNTLRGLRRGTAGTGAADHAAGSAVYSISAGNLLPIEYQDQIVSNTVLSDGSTTVFQADNLSVVGPDSTEIDLAVQVYVGGILQQGNYTLTSADPVSITFDQAPPAGREVTIQVRRGLWWYDISTPEQRDLSLQENASAAARFIRGN